MTFSDKIRVFFDDIAEAIYRLAMWSYRDSKKATEDVKRGNYWPLVIFFVFAAISLPYLFGGSGGDTTNTEGDCAPIAGGDVTISDSCNTYENPPSKPDDEIL